MLYYEVVILLVIFLSIIMIDFIRDNDVLDKKFRIGFMATFGCVALASGFECLAQIMDGYLCINSSS